MQILSPGMLWKLRSGFVVLVVDDTSVECESYNNEREVVVIQRM